MSEYIKAIVFIIILYPLCYLAALKMAMRDLKRDAKFVSDEDEPLTGACPFEQKVIDACRRDGMSDEEIRDWLKQI